MSWKTHLFCEDCQEAILLDDVPPIDNEDSVAFARRIAQLRPNLLPLVINFARLHQGHRYGPCAIQPIEEFKRSQN